jgi:uroporphyrinogen decarboxylase
MDYLLYPEFAHEALDILMEMILKALDKLLRLPIDGVTFGDDFGTQKGLMLSRNIFLEFHKPRLAKMYEKVRDAGKIVGQHSCGDNTEIMGDFIDIGLQVFHPLQPEAMDIGLIKKRFGNELTFRGGISTQCIPFITPLQAGQEVLQAVELLSCGSGYLMETSKPLLQETPIENVIAVIEAMVRAAGYKY